MPRTSCVCVCVCVFGVCVCFVCRTETNEGLKIMTSRVQKMCYMHKMGKGQKGETAQERHGMGKGQKGETAQERHGQA